MVSLAKLLRIRQGIEKKYKNMGFEKFLLSIFGDFQLRAWFLGRNNFGCFFFGFLLDPILYIFPNHDKADYNCNFLDDFFQGEI